MHDATHNAITKLTCSLWWNLRLKKNEKNNNNTSPKYFLILYSC